MWSIAICETKYLYKVRWKYMKNTSFLSSSKKYSQFKFCLFHKRIIEKRTYIYTFNYLGCIFRCYLLFYLSVELFFTKLSHYHIILKLIHTYMRRTIKISKWIHKKNQINWLNKIIIYEIKWKWYLDIKI